MKVLYAFVCEAGQERTDGRVDVHGIFHQLHAPSFPARQDHLTLAVAVEWEPHEQGKPVPLSIELVDPGRSPVLSITGQTEVSEQQPFMGPPKTQIVLPIDGVIFPVEGTYVFELVVNEQRERLAPLHIIKTPGTN